MIRIDKNDPKNDPLLAALAGVGVILTFVALIAVYGLPFKYLPEVMIGEEGLWEMQKYLHILLLGQVLVLVGLPALYLLFSVLYHRIRHIPFRPLFIAGPIVAGLLFSFMNAIDALADAPENTVGKEFKRWSPISGLSIKHSNGETDFVVYMNIDIEKYETAPQSEADVYFRINGKIHGKKIIRYLAYDPELRALWDILEEARN